VSWLFYRLRDDFRELIDGCSKIEFYGRLARAAARYQKSLNGTEESVIDVLNAIFAKACDMLQEMEERRFQVLYIAPPGVIAEDLMEMEREEAEKEARERSSLSLKGDN